MKLILVTLWVSQLLMGWLNDLAYQNILFMSVTFDVSQVFSGWLNDEAYPNMSYIEVTHNVFQASRGWLNNEAYQNILFISLTLEVSHDATVAVPIVSSITMYRKKYETVRIFNGHYPR